MQVAVPAGTDLPNPESRPSSAGLKGKSAPAAFGSVSQLDGAPEPWQRGRTHAVKRLSPLKAVGSSPCHRPLSPSSDTSSGLGTSIGSDFGESSSGGEDAHTQQLANRKVTFHENVHSTSRASGESQQSHHLHSPFDAAAQLAHPQSTLPSGQDTLHPASRFAQGFNRAASTMNLPRADVMVIGGDLAYPNPSNETYEQRFFRPFEAALPPPPHVRPGRLVVYKPDLPGAADFRQTTHAESQGTNAHESPYNPSRYHLHKIAPFAFAKARHKPAVQWREQG